MSNMKRIFLVAAAICLAVYLNGCSANDYRDACELLESGAYREAQAAFEALGAFKDSETMAMECRYRAVQEAMNHTEWYESERVSLISELTELGEYKDSPEMLKELYYHLGFLLSYQADSLDMCALATDYLEKSGDYGEDTEELFRNLRGRSLWCYLQETGIHTANGDGEGETYLQFSHLPAMTADKGTAFSLRLYSEDAYLIRIELEREADKSTGSYVSDSLDVLVSPGAEECALMARAYLQWEYNDMLAVIIETCAGSIDISMATNTEAVTDAEFKQVVLDVYGNTKEKSGKENMIMIQHALDLYPEILLQLDAILEEIPVSVTKQDLGFA